MDAYLIVDPDSRNITIPEVESAFGVYGDNNAERKYFKAPRIVGNGIDLTECYLYVNYISASTKIGQILCDVGDAPNGTATEDEIVFSWPITRNVLDKNVSGEIFFAVQAKTKTGDTVFTTRKAKGNCYESIEGTEAVAEEYADIVLQLISRMDNVEANIGEQVAAYFKENPAVTTEYLDQTLQPVKDDVSQLKEDLSDLSEQINVISDERNFVPVKISFSDNVGKFITNSGVIGTNEKCSISDLIPIKSGNKKMRITFKKANVYIARVAFLKKNVLSNDNIISFFVNGDSGTFDIEIPEGAKYVVVNSDTDDRGLTENGYPRARFFPSSVDANELAESVNGLNAKVGEISEKLVDSVVETEIEPIYEKYLGKYVTPQGTIASNVYYSTSNPISIDEMVDRIKVEIDTGNIYVSRIVFLSSDSLTVSNMIWFSVDTTKPVAEYEVPNNAKYFCVAKDVDASGNVHGDYPHVITVATKKSEISDLRDKIAGIERSDRKPALNIGSKIYAVIGDTLQIFKKKHC